MLLFQTIKDAATRFSYDNCDVFVMAILSHGGDGHVYGTDEPFEIKIITNYFRGDMCPTLAGKPKLFIFQVQLVTLCKILLIYYISCNCIFFIRWGGMRMGRGVCRDIRLLISTCLAYPYYQRPVI